MHLHARHGHALQGIPQGDAGVRVGRRIEDDAVVATATGADAVNQFALVVRLMPLELDRQLRALAISRSMMTSSVSAP